MLCCVRLVLVFVDFVVMYLFKEKFVKKIVIVALLSAFAATPALADNTGRFYVAGDLGPVSLSNTTVPPVGSYTATTFQNPNMIRIAGGYHFSPMMAVEIGYAKFGDSTISYPGIGDATLAMHSFQVAAVGTFPLNPQFDLIGKLGFSNNTEKLTGTGGFANINTSESKTDLLIGIGAQYNVTSQVGIRAQLERFGKYDSFSSPVRASVLSVGVAYTF